MTDTDNDLPTVIDFIDNTFTNACGILSKQLGGTEDWDDLACLTETLQALRAMPTEFQEGVAEHIIANMFKTLGLADLDLNDRRYRMTDFDAVIASAVKDGFAMTVQSLQSQPSGRPARTSGLTQPATKRLIT